VFNAHAVPPFPPADTREAAIRGAAIAVVSYIVGEHVVSRVGQMLHLDHEVDLNGIKVTPGLT